MIPIVQRNVRELDLELLDEPELAMRDSLDDVKFDELVDSIRLNGVQVPLIVEQRGARYLISAGHRRWLACKKLGASTVPCDVRQPGELDTEAIKIIENDDREKANPAETALYLQRLLDRRAHGDVEALCAIVRRPRKYVEDRLVLFHGDADVFDALRQRKIGLGVAHRTWQRPNAVSRFDRGHDIWQGVAHIAHGRARGDFGEPRKGFDF